MIERRMFMVSVAALGLVRTGRAMADGDVVLERGYVPCRYGQIHYHMARPADPAKAVHNPIGCLHPSPASGRYYLDLIKDLGRDRIAIAFDTPGYGESDRPPSPPDLDGYTGAFADAIKALDIGSMDLLGYHTGCSIAVNLSLTHPDLVRRLCLVAVPFYVSAERRAKMVENLDRRPYTEEGERIIEEWERSVKKRADGVTLEQGIDVFMERLRAGDKEWWAYQAVFQYPSPEKYAEVTHPTALLNPHGVLYDETLEAKKAMPNAVLVDLPQLSHGVFHVGSHVVAEAARGFLDTSA